MSYVNPLNQLFKLTTYSVQYLFIFTYWDTFASVFFKIHSSTNSTTNTMYELVAGTSRRNLTYKISHNSRLLSYRLRVPVKLLGGLLDACSPVWRDTVTGWRGPTGVGIIAGDERTWTFWRQISNDCLSIMQVNISTAHVYSDGA